MVLVDGAVMVVWWPLMVFLAGLVAPAPLATHNPPEDTSEGHLKSSTLSGEEVTTTVQGLLSSPRSQLYTPTPPGLYEATSDTPRGQYEATSATPRGLYVATSPTSNGFHEATSATANRLYEVTSATLLGLHDVSPFTVQRLYETPPTTPQGIFETPLPTLRGFNGVPTATPRVLYEAPLASLRGFSGVPTDMPRGDHEAPRALRATAAGSDGGKSGGVSNKETQVAASNEIDVVPHVVAATGYARSKRKTHEFDPPFGSLSRHVEDLGRQGAHDTGSEGFIPFHYSSKWDRMDEKRKSGRGRGHHRRHRVRHGKRRREKENSELPLLDTDFSFGSIFQELNTRKSAHFYTHTPPSHTISVGEDQPHLTAVGNTATTEITVHLNQPSKFTSRNVEGPQKQKSSMPSPPPQGFQVPRTLGVHVASYRPRYISQGDLTTLDSVVAMLTPSTMVSRRQNPSVAETPTQRTPTETDKGLKALKSGTKLKQRDEITSAAQPEIFPDDLLNTKAHSTPSVEPLSGSLGPSVTQKPQDSKRDPSESNKRQAIKLGSEPSHTSQTNPGTFAQNSEPYAGLKLIIVPVTTNRSDEKHGRMFSESLPPSANISVSQLGRNHANESQEHVNNGEGSSGEHSRGKGTEAAPMEGVPTSGPPSFASLENAISELRPKKDSAAAATMSGKTGRDKEGAVARLLQLSGLTYDSKIEDSDEGVPPPTVFPTPTGKVTQPFSLPDLHENSLTRPHSSLKGPSSSNSPSSSGCYSTNDLVVVVFLTSLANMVAFVVVTVTLCWCSLRGRFNTPPRPLQHPDHPNTDDPDDEAEEIVAPEGCLEACLPDISYQRHIARGSNLRPSFVVGRALRPLVTPHTPRLSHAVHELLHNLTAPAEDPHTEGGDGRHDKGEKMANKKKPRLFLPRRSLSLENLTLT